MTWIDDTFDQFNIPLEQRQEYIDAISAFNKAGLSVDLYDFLLGIERLKEVSPEYTQLIEQSHD